MYDEIVSGFCQSCRGKKINEEYTVEDAIKSALHAGETNNVIGGYFLIHAAYVTLKTNNGCQFCLGVLQNMKNKLQGYIK